MALLMVHDIPGGTQEQYEAACGHFTGGGSPRSLGDWPVDGILFHAAAPTEDGFRVVDVWESEEAFQAFGPVIGPALEAEGLGGEPKLYPLHNLVQ